MAAPFTPSRRRSAELHEIVFFQRPLKEPEIGKCTLIPTEERLPKAHPLLQRRRLLEEVNALEIVVPGAAARKLQKAERDLLVARASNKESTNRKDLIGDEDRRIAVQRSWSSGNEPSPWPGCQLNSLPGLKRFAGSRSSLIARMLASFTGSAV